MTDLDALEETWRCEKCGERYREIISGHLIDGDRYCGWCATIVTEENGLPDAATE